MDVVKSAIKCHSGTSCKSTGLAQVGSGFQRCENNSMEQLPPASGKPIQGFEEVELGRGRPDRKVGQDWSGVEWSGVG